MENTNSTTETYDVIEWNIDDLNVETLENISIN